MRTEMGGGRAYGLTATIAFVAAMFLLGGSARDDVLSLAVLRPLAVLFLGFALVMLPREVWRDNKLLVAIALALPLLTLIHLIPLPPSVWHALPGRDLAWEIGQRAGIEQPWRPISLVPFRTWNSFWAFFAPLAALALALGLEKEQSKKLVLVLVGIILVSGLLGLLQSIGAPGNRFYTYAVTNEDSAVGLFANRNHQAMLLACAFPVLAAAASLVSGAQETLKPKVWLAAGAAVMILPFLLVTESRAGLLLGGVGIVTAFFVYRSPSADPLARRETRRTDYRWAAIGAVATALLLLTVLVARVSSVQRLFGGGVGGDIGGDLRMQVWGPITDASWSYFPVGTGMGTFVEVYRITEPDQTLSPLYLNHAHNDWLEMFMTAGLPGLLICAAALLFLGAAIFRAFVSRRRDQSSEALLARLGGAIVLILGLGSIYDYPLRTPSLACLFAIATVWLVRGTRRRT